MGRRAGDRVTDFIEALGLRTFGKETEEEDVVVKRPKFRFQPVLDLYKKDLQSLYAKLSSDPTLKREDPSLFDKELDQILKKHGSAIWSTQKKRPHMRDPDPESLYTKDLVYPRDKTIIKKHLRKLVLAKRSRGSMTTTMTIPNINSSTLRDGPSTEKTTGAKKSSGTFEKNSSKRPRENDPDADEDSVLGDAAIASRKKRRTEDQDANGASAIGSPAKGKKKVEQATGGAAAFEQSKLVLFSHPLSSHKTITLKNCKSVHELFERVATAVEDSAGATSPEDDEDEKPGISFVKVFLSEDMGPEPFILIENKRTRRSTDATFGHLRNLIVDAPLYPGSPDCTLETEVGFY